MWIYKQWKHRFCNGLSDGLPSAYTMLSQAGRQAGALTHDWPFVTHSTLIIRRICLTLVTMKNTQIAFNSAAFNGNEHEIPLDTRNHFNTNYINCGKSKLSLDNRFAFRILNWISNSLNTLINWIKSFSMNQYSNFGFTLNIIFSSYLQFWL